jgi:hypothetical protein
LKELNICPSLYFTYREQSRAFETLGLYTGGTGSVTRIGMPEEVPVLQATHEILPLLGITPAAGRFFSAGDDVEGAPRTTVLAWGYAQERFNGAGAIGRHMTIDGEDREVIGVLPRSFRFMDPQPAMVLPLRFNRAKVVLGNFSFRGIARLRPGVTFAQANSDVARMLPIWLTSFPAPPGFSPKLFEDAHVGPNIRPFKQDVVGDIGNVLWVVMAPSDWSS